MLDPNNLDFEKLGFHAGLEIHHQIKSQRKLFCNCPPIMEEDPENLEYSFYRYFRPVLGEMGDFDPGMLVEFEKGYKVIYFANYKNTCTYEMDETPPFFPDMEAIENGFQLAAYFNCSSYAEEIVVNRKQYLDGSITTGFQRTFIIGRDGWIPVNGKKVRITNVHIEEDAARRVNWDDTSKRTVFFNLDRLGVPLTEVITEYLDVDTPKELIETAKQIGRVLRLSGIGRRGLGSARQDVNISITGGDRVELKGVQDLDMFDIMCRHEVVRQDALIEIQKEMKARGITEESFEHTYIDISHLFDIEEEENFYATVFPKMAGLFGKEVQPNKDFGEEIFEKSMLISGISRADHFHTDELMDGAVRSRSSYKSKIPIDVEMYKKIYQILNPESEDVIVVVRGLEKSALHALKKIVERVKLALDGVPQETRRFVPNGNSEFLRVIHGKDRIYPDTDTPPVVISLEKIDEITSLIGRHPWEVYNDLHEKYKFTQHQVDLLIRDEKVNKFYDYTKNLKLKGHLAYQLLIDLPREKRRADIDISDEVIDKLASALSKRIIIREQIDPFLKSLLEDTSVDPEHLASQIFGKEFSESELKNLIQEKLKSLDDARKNDEDYMNWYLPKLTGEILIECGHRFSGEYIVTQVRHTISTGGYSNE